jgi:hypothetical protein
MKFAQDRELAPKERQPIENPAQKGSVIFSCPYCT